MRLLQTILKDILTTANQDYCISKVLTVLAFVFYVVLSGFDIYIGHNFNPAGWAMGVASIIFGGCAGVKIKDSTEPQCSANKKD